MRRFVYLVAAVVPLVGATGCEDGPNQTYSPAPNNAGNVWNGSTGVGLPEGGTFTGSATEGYDASFGGTNANVLCTADEATNIWKNLFQEPILIPGLAAGLDIAGGPKGDGASGYTGPNTPYTYDPTTETWTGATLEQAEKILCQSVPSSVFYATTNTAGWGNGCAGGACEVSALYDVNSRVIQQLLFQYGYGGGLAGCVTASGDACTSPSGGNTYTIYINNLPIQLSVNGGPNQNILMNWNTLSDVYAAADPMYEALRATYIPGFAKDPGYPPAAGGSPACQLAGHCVVGNNFTQGGYIFFPPLNLALYVNNTLAPQPAASTFTLVQLGVLKLLPFSVAGNLLKLDSDGPLSVTPNPSGQNPGSNCTYKLGEPWSQFNSQCVQVYSGSLGPQNTIQENKLLGGMTHTDETFGFNNVVGIDPQFAATSLPANQVIADGQKPAANDVIYQFNVDQNALGTFTNDNTNNDPTQPADLHGFGMLMLEWANQMQQYMALNHGVTAPLGDPGCIANPLNPGDGYVCSGLEGIITTAPPALATQTIKGKTYTYPNNALGLAALNVEPGYGPGFHPGTWVADFCSVTGNPATGTGFSGCEGGSYKGPLGGFMFDSMQAMVAAAFPPPTPVDLQSRRLFFKEWVFALVKYLQSASNPNATLGQIDANPIDENSIFFDTAGGGFEQAEYVFRQFVNSNKQAPDVLDIATNLTTSVINNFTFSQLNERGETLLGTVLRTNPSDYLGAEPIFLSNITGNSVLPAVYPSYACAVNTSALACNGVIGPSDTDGQPLYAGYAPLWGQSIFAIAPPNGSPIPANIAVDTQGPNGNYPLIQSAMVTIPLWTNPYDPTTATSNTTSMLLNYVPSGSDSGFPVTIDGSRDKWYNANSLNLTGQAFAGTINYDYFASNTADGGTQQNLAIRAMQTTDYLGLVFPCSQPNPQNANATDVLSVRMYQNAADILSWLAAHPGAASACGVEIKYSIYGNYPDYISFLANGVRLGLNPGFGGAVVSDALLFDPNVVAGLGQ